MINFQYRYEITADEQGPLDADASAQLQAEDRAQTGLARRKVRGRITDVAMTCVNDLKPRKKKGRARK